ncbi:MAG: glycerophosphodiester phosphodiesterase [Ilumatobacteraceae bacterium]
MPTDRPPPHPFLDWPGPIPFAHRGGAGEAPENTLPAFARAVELGYTYLETDVHVTSDGVLVAFHDDDLLRTSGRPGRISELPWREVAEARVDGREPIPRLDDLLDAFPEARWNIDCKTDAAVPALVSAVHRHRLLDRLCVGAFSDRRLCRLRRELGDGALTSMGPARVAIVKTTGRNPGGPPVAQVPVSHGRIGVVDAVFVRRAHRAGVHVHVWTIDDRAEITRLLDLGVDGIMTDAPIVLREVLRDRGAWHDSPYPSDDGHHPS